VEGHSEKVSFIWSVADLLRGDYKASDYGKVILPFTVFRRLECLLEPTKCWPTTRHIEPTIALPKQSMTTPKW
jgi:type I restriction-modification system DNA methylase subunit